MLNRITLVGYLGKDPDMRVTSNGNACAKLRISVKRDWSKQGEQDTDWFDVITWQKQAEFCGNYLHKGSLVSVDGRLQAREYTTQEGAKRTAFEIVADRINNMTPREDRKEESKPLSQQAQDAGALFDEPASDEFDPFADA